MVPGGVTENLGDVSCFVEYLLSAKIQDLEGLADS
jgi:hypothetical protein